MSHLLVVAYHYVLGVDPREFAGLKGLTDAQFAAQMDALGARYKFIHAEDIEHCPWRDGSPRCLVTFDDGTRDQARYAAPILDAKGIPAVFFVTTGVLKGEFVIPAHLLHRLIAAFPPPTIAAAINRAATAVGIAMELDLDRPQSYYPYDDQQTGALKFQMNHAADPLVARTLLEAAFEDLESPVGSFRGEFYMGVEELRALERSGHTVAAHSHGHINLASATPDAARRDIEESARSISAFRFDRGRAHFAVPFGGPGTYSDDTLKVLRANGFTYVHVNEPSLVQTPHEVIHRFGARMLPPFAAAWPAAQ